MLENIKYFVKHSFVYSISNVATKASGIILLPIYSSNLSLSEFGALGIIEATIIILVELINLGQGQSLIMLNNSDEFAAKKKESFFTVFFTTFFICTLFISFGEIILHSDVSFLIISQDYFLYLRLALYVVALRIINSIFLNKLRAEEKSGYYTISSILKLVLNIVFITYFVAFNQFKVEGVLYAYIISEAAIFFILLPFLIGQMTPRFNKKILIASFQFGIPLILGSLGMVLLNVSDRYIIKYYMTDRDVGLYDLGYRIAGVLNMFIIMPLNLTLIPQAYKIYGKEGDKRFYSKILTYLTLLLVWVGLATSVFSKEAIKILTLNPNFWPSYTIVPIVVLAYVFFGMRIVASLGMYLTKNTKYVALTTLITAILNVVLNVIFVPFLGIEAAAYSTLIAFILLYFFSYYYSNISYPIKFEHLKIFIVIFLGIAFYFIASLFNDSTFILRMIVKIFLLLIFPIVLYMLKFYEPVEIQSIKGFIKSGNLPVNK